MVRLSAQPYEFRLQTDLPMEAHMGYGMGTMQESAEAPRDAVGTFS